MSSLTWKRQPELFKFDSRRHRCRAKPPAYDGSLSAKEITPDKTAYSVNEKWPEYLACYHKRLYLNACAAHDSFPLIRGLLYNFSNNIPYIRIAWHRIVIFNVVFPVVIAYKLSFKAPLHRRFSAIFLLLMHAIKWIDLRMYSTICVKLYKSIRLWLNHSIACVRMRKIAHVNGPL